MAAMEGWGQAENVGKLQAKHPPITKSVSSGFSSFNEKQGSQDWLCFGEEANGHQELNDG